MVRYTVSGTLDISFGAQGVVTTAVIANGGDSASAGVIQPDSKLVVAGSGQEGLWPLTNSYLALARYTTTGDLDPDFGVGGVVTTPLGMAGGANAVAIQPDGRIVVAGTSGSACNTTPFVTRYTITGSLDTGFGINGTVWLSGDYRSSSVVIQPDHKIVVVGGTTCTTGSGDRRIFLARMNQNGSLDTTFGSGGQVLTSGPGNSDVVAFGSTLQTDGKIVVAGTSVLNYKLGLNSHDIVCC